MSDRDPLPGIRVRLAEAADVVTATATISAAFHDDPFWSWVFADAERRQEHYAAWWRLFVEAGAVNRGLWVVGERAAAAAVWVPPGCSELREQDEARIEPLLEEMIGSTAPIAIEALDRFEEHHPRERPHYYLSLVGTHPDHRGHGIGVALLARNLARIDAEGMPAYLESTNPRNLARYERLGFVRHDEFDVPGGAPTVTTMWREPRASQRAGAIMDT